MTMNRNERFHWAAVWATSCLLAPAVADNVQGVPSECATTVMRAVPDQGGVMIMQADSPVLHYQSITQSLDGDWPRANYVHPLHDLRGNVITEDFPPDHRHHRGIFWAWHQIRIGDKKVGDPWACKDFVWDVTELQTSSADDLASLCASVHWKSPLHVDAAGAMIPIVLEKTKITVHRAQATYRLIDFEISLRALVDGVQIGGSENVKGYGGFSPRIALSDDLRFIAQGGEIKPTTTAVTAGDWINIAGSRRGFAILTHADNPGRRGEWILRRKTSMQNAVYPGRHLVPVSTTRPTTLRYRLVIHQGDLSSDTLSALQQGFSQR